MGKRVVASDLDTEGRGGGRVPGVALNVLHLVRVITQIRDSVTVQVRTLVWSQGRTGRTVLCLVWWRKANAMLAMLPAMEARRCAYPTCGDWYSRLGDTYRSDQVGIGLVHALVFVGSTMRRVPDVGARPAPPRRWWMPAVISI